MLKIKADVDLKQLGFEKNFDEFENITAWIKSISTNCFIAIFPNGKIQKWQTATRNGYFTKYDKEKPIRKKDLILAGLVEKVVDDE